MSLVEWWRRRQQKKKALQLLVSSAVIRPADCGIRYVVEPVTVEHTVPQERWSVSFLWGPRP